MNLFIDTHQEGFPQATGDCSPSDPVNWLTVTLNTLYALPKPNTLTHIGLILACAPIDGETEPLQMASKQVQKASIIVELGKGSQTSVFQGTTLEKTNGRLSALA